MRIGGRMALNDNHFEILYSGIKHNKTLRNIEPYRFLNENHGRKIKKC